MVLSVQSVVVTGKEQEQLNVTLQYSFVMLVNVLPLHRAVTVESVLYGLRDCGVR